MNLLKRRLRMSFSFLVFFLVLAPLFQNCTPGFQTQEQSLQLNSQLGGDPQLPTTITSTTTSTSTTSTTLAPPPPVTYTTPVYDSQNGFTVSGSVSHASIVAGNIQSAKVTVKSDSAQSNVLVAVRFLDPNFGQMIDRTISTSFAAGETKEISLDYAFKLDTPAGNYTLAVGIWNSDYSTMYFYNRTLPTFQIISANYVAPAPVTSMPANQFSMTGTPDAFFYAGPYFVQNNMWGATGLRGPYYENTGIGPVTSNNSVSARWNWSFPDGPNEVKGYPAVGIGQKPGQNSTPNSGMPRQISTINSVVTSWDVQAMYTGLGHLSYDLWLTKDGNKYSCFPCTPITHEIMLAVDNFGGYAVSNPSWYFTSTIIDGVTYRVWKADNFGGGGATWRFIVLQMVNPIHVTKGSVDFKHVFDYLKSVGLITGQEYLSSIEFGNEMVYGTGDVYIKDFKAEVK